MLNFIICTGIICLFIFLLDKLKRLNLNSLLFLVGTMGTFLIYIFMLRHQVEQVIRYYFLGILNYISQYMDYFNVYEKASALTIMSQGETLSLIINYECLAVLEHVSYTILVIFFPFIKRTKNTLYIICGNIYILCANVLRMIIIVETVNIFGTGYYIVAHEVLARIIFFILILVLYFVVFTKNHVKNQKIGGREK